MRNNVKVGRLHASKGRRTFVATVDDGKCPRVSTARLGSRATFRDDYHGKLKIDKSIARLIFKG